MKPRYDLLICVAGWEERFVKGVKANLNDFQIDTLLIWKFEEFKELTISNTTEVLNHAWFLDVETQERSLRRRPEEIWSIFQAVYAEPAYAQRRVLLDITTMPREVIWWTLGCLKQALCSVDFVYYHPISYSADWLTRDTAQPRLVYQHSGIAKLNKPTALLLLSGFDIERAAQIVRFFEPGLLLVGIQTGDQFQNHEKNLKLAETLKKRIKNVRTFTLNAFSEDAGYSDIEANIGPILGDYNIVAASLGPKTSAVSLFSLVTKYPEIALAYAPSRQFNQEYSSGIGERLSGRVLFEVEPDTVG